MPHTPFVKQGPFVNDGIPPINATRANNFDQAIYDAHQVVPQVVDTIDVLRGLSGTQLTSSARARVNGYYAANDGAAFPQFFYNTADTRADNGGTVIKPNTVSGAGRWNLDISDDYLVDRWFGVVGNTTTTTANTTSVSNTITNVASNSTFVVGQWVLIRGAGTNGGGNDLYARIGSISGTTWTLVDTSGNAVNASATLTGATIFHDDTTPLANMASAAYDTSLSLALRMRLTRGNFNARELNLGTQQILFDGRETISAAIYYIGSGEANVSTTGDITSGTKTLTVANAAGLIPHRYIRVLTAGPSSSTLVARINSITGPTGSMTATSQNITGVSSTAGLANGQTVQVIGAGTNGGALTANITNISGSTVTLDTAASISVTGTVFFRTGVSTTVTLDTAASTTATGQSVLFKGGYLMRTTGFSWGGLKGMRLYGRDINNTTAAENIVQMRGSGPDMMSDINWVTFAHCYGDAIHTGHQVATFNFDIKKVRFDGVGGHSVYIAGHTSNENRPFKMFEFTVDNNIGASQVTLFQNLGYHDGTRWGKAVVGVGNSIGLSLALENARIEMNYHMKENTGVLLHEYQTSASGAGFFTVRDVKGFSSTARTARRPVVYTQTGEINVVGEGDNNIDFSTADIYRADTNEYIWPQGHFRGHIEWRRRVTQDHGRKDNGRKIHVHDYNDVNTFMRYKFGDILLHPAAQMSVAQRPLGKMMVEPTTGYAQRAGGTITAVATINGTITITNVQTSTSSTSNEPVPGDNIVIVNGNGAGNNHNCQIVSYDPNTNSGTIVVDVAPSSTASNVTINHRTPTFREITGEYATAAPGSGTYVKGEKVWNSNAVNVGDPIGWVCTVAGTPGTWVKFGVLAA